MKKFFISLVLSGTMFLLNTNFALASDTTSVPSSGENHTTTAAPGKLQNESRGARAKSKRVLVYTEEETDDQGYPIYYNYELEPDSFGEMKIKDIHYVTFWAANIGKYFNNFFYDKANWGSYHFLFKFYPDGSYRTRRNLYSKSEAKHKENLNLV